MNSLLRNKGFSLIELIVALAIAGIIAAVAIPSYTGSMDKARRVDAQSALMGLSASLERYYTTKSSYIGATSGSDAHGSIPDPAVYASEAPLEGSTKYYDLRIKNLTATSYELFAYPKGSQEKDGALRLTSTNQRGWDRDNDNSFSQGWQ